MAQLEIVVLHDSLSLGPVSAGGKRTAWLESLPAGTSLSIFTQGGVPGSAGARESQPWAQGLPMLLWHHGCHRQLAWSQAERPPRAEEEATLHLLHTIVELRPGPRLHFLFPETGPYAHLRTSCLTLPSTPSVLTTSHGGALSPSGRGACLATFSILFISKVPACTPSQS